MRSFLMGTRHHLDRSLALSVALQSFQPSADFERTFHCDAGAMEKPISGRSWRNVQREMKDLLQKPGAPPLREDADCAEGSYAIGSASFVTVRG